MSLSDCEKCWNTPCTCGHYYMSWSEEAIKKQIKMLQDVLKQKEPRIKWGDIPDYGDKMTIAEYTEDVNTGCLMEDDGYGAYASDTQMSYIDTDFYEGGIKKTIKEYPEFTHVIWFNK